MPICEKETVFLKCKLLFNSDFFKKYICIGCPRHSLNHACLGIRDFTLQFYFNSFGVSLKIQCFKGFYIILKIVDLYVLHCFRNGVNVEGATHRAVVELIKAGGEHLELLVISVSSEEANRFVFYLVIPFRFKKTFYFTYATFTTLFLSFLPNRHVNIFQ